MKARHVTRHRVVRHARPASHAQQIQAQKKQQQLALHRQQLAQQGLVSPYDGTSPIGGVGAVPGMPVGGANGAGLLGGAGRPQVNATNQSALAPNGDINQSVTNNNHYDNKYYNIVTTPQFGYGGGGYFNPYQPGYGSMGGQFGGNSFVDPQTGVMYTRQENGILGWFKRLLRGY